MAAARMQRWALILSAYQYTNEHVSVIIVCPVLFGQSRDSTEKVHIVMQADDLLVTASQIAKESEQDSELPIVIKSMVVGQVTLR